MYILLMPLKHAHKSRHALALMSSSNIEQHSHTFFVDAIMPC